MKGILIGGIGNVLLGDDAVGPYVVRLLESSYAFGDDVEIVDLGTPALDLTHQIAARDVVILVDCVASDSIAPGTVQLFREGDILQTLPAQRLDPHSPALAECLLAAEMLGASPRHVLLIGIVGASYEPGQPLSESVRQAAANAIQAILIELQQLAVEYQKTPSPAAPRIWWADSAILNNTNSAA